MDLEKDLQGWSEALAPAWSVALKAAEAARCADLVIDLCGAGRVLNIGCGDGALLQALLDRGADAYGLDASSDVAMPASLRRTHRIMAGGPLSLPYVDDAFDTLVSIDVMQRLREADVAEALRELRRVTARYVVLRIVTLGDGSGLNQVVKDRQWWEARCFEAGFRKHPMYYRANPYEALNADGARIVIVLEVVPETAMRHFDLEVLPQERMLHTDMLREVGRRSDAHCIRYHKAAEFIRPGDRVLDVACGLGYGSHILYANSAARMVLGVDLSGFGIDYANAHYRQGHAVRFQVGDAQTLDGIPDHSIDFVAAFETIEHVPDPQAYLRALRRVLVPSGRVMVCAPNDWTDETGKDPNPHHLHVYTWQRLVAEVGAVFLLEQGFLQTAGGALKCHHSARSWSTVPTDAVPSEEAEWVLLLAMADPVSHAGVPYTETAWPLPDRPEFHVAAFARDYANPWLVRSMVSIGMRARSPTLLHALQSRVRDLASPESVDYGAALCGTIYASLTAPGAMSSDAIEALQLEVQRYAAISEPSPHQLRWQVSLLYAVGELARRQGRWPEAGAFFEECASRDVTPYSPLLGNKVLDALHWLAVSAQSRGDLLAARAYLQRATEQVQRWLAGPWTNIVGLADAPWPVGLAEAAQLLDKAARAAYMLSTLESAEYRPGYAMLQAQGFFERQLRERDARLEQLAQVAQAGVDAVLELRRSHDVLAAEVVAREARSHELAAEVGRQSALAQEMGKLASERDAAAQEFARQLSYMDAEAQRLARAVGERDAAAQTLGKEVAKHDATAQVLAQQLRQLDDDARRLAQEVIERDRAAHAFAAELLQARAAIERLEAAGVGHSQKADADTSPPDTMNEERKA
jgi:ubiquinone/menaquinone biosynthesis C-methylase UbiE